MTALRDEWEETSFQLELHQTNHDCVKQEQEGLKSRKHPTWKLSFDPESLHVRSLGMNSFRREIEMNSNNVFALLSNRQRCNEIRVKTKSSSRSRRGNQRRPRNGCISLLCWL
jgi:hypothetical protein